MSTRTRVAFTRTQQEHQGDDDAPLCKGHKMPCVLRQVRKEGPNTGRWFYTCAVVGDGCNMFKWAAEGARAGSTGAAESGSGQGGSRTPGNRGHPVLNNPIEAAEVVTLQLVREERFGVASRYKEELVDVFKQHTDAWGSYWDSGSRLWTFDLDAYEDVCTALSSLELDVELRKIPEWVRKAVKTKAITNATKEAEAERRMASTLALKGTVHQFQDMFGFQKEALNIGIRWGGRILLADEMGLGKTVQAIALAASYPSDWPLLIICPSSLRYKWKQELLEWLPASYAAVHVMDTSRDQPPADGSKMRACIVSYDLVTKLQQTAGYGIIIADECHFLKSQSAKRSQCVLPLLERAPRAVLLSGTPALSRPIELFTQIRAVQPNLFPNMHNFGLRYCAAVKGARFGPGEWDYSGASNLKELHLLLEARVYVRRLKSDVAGQMPNKLRSTIPLEVDRKRTKGCEQIMAELEQIQSSASIDENYRKQLMSQLYNESAPAKLPAVVDYIKHVLVAGEKMLVFAHHQEMMDGIQADALSGVKHIRIDGSTPASKRHDLVNAFQNDASCRVGLLSITAAGTGLTFTAAKLVIFAELSWTPGLLMQAEDRAHRIGQESVVVVQYLLAKRTVDDIMWKTINHKLSVVGAAVDNNACAAMHATRGAAQHSNRNGVSAQDLRTFFQVQTASPVGCSEHRTTGASGCRLGEDVRGAAASTSHERTAQSADGLGRQQSTPLSDVGKASCTPHSRSEKHTQLDGGATKDSPIMLDDDSPCQSPLVQHSVDKHASSSHPLPASEQLISNTHANRNIACGAQVGEKRTRDVLEQATPHSCPAEVIVIDDSSDDEPSEVAAQADHHQSVSASADENAARRINFSSPSRLSTQ